MRSNPLDIFILGMICLAGFGATTLVLVAVIWHFWVGADIPLIAIANSNSAQYWGQLGDFVGGMLNPFLSFVALMAVLYSIRMQRAELRLARQDAKDNYDIQIQQRQNIERQNFEAVFFRLLDIHIRLTAELKVSNLRGPLTGQPQLLIGQAAFNALHKHYFFGGVGEEAYIKHLKVVINDFDESFSHNFSHYFRNLYQLLKHIESFGVDPLRMNRKYSFFLIRQLLKQYYDQRIYANMLRAQLHNAELSILFLNCLTVKGEGLKYYVEKYSMLKHLSGMQFVRYPEVRSTFYDDLAFADGEDVEPQMLRAHYNSWAEKKSDGKAS
ncbi:hypothetical protein AL064_19015 [Pseudomonas syringae pv. syringae]|nr:hypothetical protein AL064_19015 [Pseudomonas syringae pv. syringae]